MSQFSIWGSVVLFFSFFITSVRAEGSSGSSSYRDMFGGVERAGPLEEGKGKGKGGGSKGGKSRKKKKKADDVNLVPGSDPFLSFVSLEQNSLIGIAKSQPHLEALWEPLDIVSTETAGNWSLGGRESSLDSQVQSELLTQLGWFGGGGLATPPNLSGVTDHQIGQSVPYQPLPRSSIGSAKLTNPGNSVLSKWELLGEIYGKEFGLALIDTLDDVAIAITEVANGGVALQAHVYNPGGIFFDQVIPQIDTSKAWHDSLYTKPLNRKTAEEAIHEFSGGLFDLFLEKKGGRVAKELAQRYGASALKWVVRLLSPIKAGPAWNPAVIDPILKAVLTGEQLDDARKTIADTIGNKMRHFEGLPLPPGIEDELAKDIARDVSTRVRKKGVERFAHTKGNGDFTKAVRKRARAKLNKYQRGLTESLAKKLSHHEQDSFFAAVHGTGEYVGSKSGYEFALGKLRGMANVGEGTETSFSLAAKHILEGGSPFLSHYQPGELPVARHALGQVRNEALAFLAAFERGLLE